ncbi:AarF/UbiB family protein [Rhodococcus sp. X156]|uniref:ABC1 kinase family protein n=1 Tax=Rhodococcus sp. X156 TaxID=2499145 RepID=UPI0013E39972|nr:AarF/UbiB family protein [Rhodococcus sp. X156]
MSDIPRSSAARTAKLASLPIGFAGRTAAGWGKRLAGRSSEDVGAELSAKTAEQLFAVLGELKGGAMKFGQALSVFEAAVPDEMAGPYREALTKLQASAPPMPAATVHKVLAEQLGTGWRERFQSFDDVAAAAASIGQVHRGVWHDGREVAVKIQYPGADVALRSDLRQLQRFGRMFQSVIPGMQVRPLIDELRERMEEELDYRAEADNQRAFAAAYDGDPDFMVPKVVASAPKVIVSEWVEGTGLSTVIAEGTPEQRNEMGRLLALFHFSSPARAGLLHSDPHPGNYLLLPDNRMGVIDFGAVARLPDGLPVTFGRMIRLAIDDKPDELMEMLREERFVPRSADLDPAEVLGYLRPFVEPMQEETFHFTRRWMQGQAERVSDVHSDEFQLARSLNLPPQYLLIHRVTLGSIGILCQLDAEAPFRAIVQEWQPGAAED